MKIAIAQLNPTIGDIKGNAQAILQSAQIAHQKGADLLLTPELSLCGYPPKDLLLNPSFIESLSRKLSQLAQNLPSELTVLVGTVENNNQAKITGEKSLFNSIALLSQGKIQTIFHKRLLPNYDVFDEDRYFESGKESHIFTIGNTKIGVTICEDLWNDEIFWQMRRYQVNPVADLVNLGSQLILNLSASPYSVKKQQLREAIADHTAKRYQVPLIYTNQVGGNDDLIFDGNSFAVNRAGEVIGRANSFVTDLLILEFDETKQDLSLSNINPLPETDEEEIYSALVLGVKDYAQKCG
jgi:predicted amidohydrolase